MGEISCSEVKEGSKKCFLKVFKVFLLFVSGLEEIDELKLL